MVLTAAGGEEGLLMYRENKDYIDAIILDMTMPKMSGKRCLKYLLGINPEARVIIASGFSPDKQMKDALDAGAKGSIDKPYSLSRMLSSLRDVLTQS